MCFVDLYLQEDGYDLDTCPAVMVTTPETNTVSWSDIGGLDDIKKDILETLVCNLSNLNSLCQKKLFLLTHAEKN